MSTDVLLNIASAARLFHTSDSVAFADLIIDGHRETWPVRSKRFGAWLRQQYYERTWDAPQRQPSRPRSMCWRHRRNSTHRAAPSQCGSPSRTV